VKIATDHGVRSTSLKGAWSADAYRIWQEREARLEERDRRTFHARVRECFDPEDDKVGEALEEGWEHRQR
jgi:hypothetical protein